MDWLFSVVFFGIIFLLPEPQNNIIASLVGGFWASSVGHPILGAVFLISAVLSCIGASGDQDTSVGR